MQPVYPLPSLTSTLHPILNWIAIGRGLLSKNHKAFFETYCLECHDSQTREGSVDLETLPLQITNLEHAESWQKVLNVLNSGEMPPEDSTQPGNVEKTDLLEALAKTMVNARKRLSDAGGKSRCVGSTDVNTGTALSS